MNIDFRDNLYIATIAFEQRHAFQAAGWRWHDAWKRWVTHDPKLALPFRAFSTPAAEAAFQVWDSEVYGELRLSFAESMDVDIPAPQGLTYAAYQKPGIIYAERHKNVLIADPPGLGKTIEAIGVSNYLPEVRDVLIICPASLKVNWKREWIKWDIKGLHVELAESTPRKWPEDAEVVIINYDTLTRFESEIKSRVWDLVIFDEAQYLAHETSSRSRFIFGGPRMLKTVKRKGETTKVWAPAVEPLQALRRLFLSGTPILTRPVDLWTICRACDPQGLGKDWYDFVYTYCGGEDIHLGYHPKTKKPIIRTIAQGATNLDQLQIKLRTKMMIRRTKASVLKLLPPKTRKLVILPSTGLTKLVDREISAATRVRDALAEFEGLLVDPVAPVDWSIFTETLEEKLARFNEMDYEAAASHMGPAISVAFEEWSVIRKELAAAKIKMVKEHLDNILATGEKVVVFVVHTEMAEALKAHYPQCGFITGRVSPNKRQAEVDRFQNDSSCNIMVGNLIAAGVGHTMTASRWVVFAELDFVATRITQAEDRVHRIGQNRGCMSEHLVVEGTSDSHMVQVFLERLKIERNALDIEALPLLSLEQNLMEEKAQDA